MNKIYRLRFRAVDKYIFNAIKTGQKKVETRAATPRYQKVKVGDTLLCVCGQQSIYKKIIKVKIFRSITALLKKYHLADINPRLKSVGELRKMYASFPNYKGKIKKYGLIALELR